LKEKKFRKGTKAGHGGKETILVARKGVCQGARGQTRKREILSRGTEKGGEEKTRVKRAVDDPGPI